MLSFAWSEVAEQNNFNEMAGDLSNAFSKFNVKRDGKFMSANLRKEAVYFGANAYGETAYSRQGMVDCFCHVLEDFGLVKPAVAKKIRKHLLG